MAAMPDFQILVSPTTFFEDIPNFKQQLITDK